MSRETHRLTSGLVFVILASMVSPWLISSNDEEAVLLLALGVLGGVVARTWWSVLLLPLGYTVGFICALLGSIIWAAIRDPAVILDHGVYVSWSIFGELAVTVGYVVFFYLIRLFTMALPTMAGTLLGKGFAWASRTRFHNARF